MFIDTHCHLDAYEEFSKESLDALFERLRSNTAKLSAGPTANGEASWNSPKNAKEDFVQMPEAFIHVACSPESFDRGVELSEKYPFVFTAYGIHPECVLRETPSDEERLLELLKHPKAIACGEFGLDYHYGKDTRKQQLNLFQRHLQLGIQSGKPLVLHLREADDNTQQYIDSVNAAAQTDADKLADAQNITHHYLGETRNFSRCDDDFAASTRFGLLADPWVVTPNIINQDNFTHGGFDNFENSQSISVEKWDGVLPAIEDGKIYQTTFAALPAGTYHLHFYVHANSGFSANECLLRVVSGDAFPGLATKDGVLATYDVRTGGYNGTVDACTFQLDEPTVVTIGFLFNIPEQNNGRAMRVNDLRIYDSANRDVTSKYLQNYTNIQRKDLSYRRFGQPTFWTVENFEISNGTDGTKHGIDKYAGDNELMLGVWNDAGNAKGSLRDAKLYQRVTLPAGDYFFGAAYEACYNIASGNLFVGTSALTAATTKTKALAYLPLSEAATDGKWYGKEFSLREPTELYLGWNIDLTTASTQEFRARELALLRLGDKRAEEAWQLGEELKANEVSRLLTAKNALNAEGKAVLTLERGCEVELGHALLDGVTAVELWTNTLYSVAQDATLSLYLDDDFDPVATCQASDVQSTTPQRSVLYLPALTGIHRLTLQVYGTQCNLWKAVLSNEEDGIGSPSSAQPATNHGIFDLTGRRVTRPTRGLYIQDGRKIIR
ncbi:MAG: DUF5013 domain-containing protein [Bacteroidaceae bacterium]|nr:DUF5013 domain-containing protein [Bacteroidaceae bacterium]